jgi:peptidoglycan/LPS O-acetylase OafA/YrhL
VTSLPSQSGIGHDRIAGLDTLRSVAIFHVLLAHGAMMFLPHFPGALGTLLWLVVATNFGVPLFLVLSGFLITRQFAYAIPTRKFYRNRLGKIYPTYALAVLIFGGLNSVEEPGIWLLHLAGFQNVAWSISSRVSGHLWSLAVEMQFYLVAPLLFQWGYKLLSSFLVTIIGLVSFAMHGLWVLSLPESQAVRLSALLDVYQFSSFNFIALILGAWLYKLYSENRSWSHVRLIGIVSAIGMPLICALVVPSLRVDEVDLTRVNSVAALLSLVSLAPVASVALTYHVLKINWTKWRIWHSVTSWVAALSYQCYLWHALVLLFFEKTMRYHPELQKLVEENPWISLGIYIVLSVILARITYRWVEAPLHRRISGRRIARMSNLKDAV